MNERQASSGEPSFNRIAGWSAILTAAIAFIYSIAFVVLKSDGLAAIALLAGGLLTVAAVLGLRARIRSGAPNLTDLGSAFAVVGSLGASIHGAYNLAVVIHPPAVATDFPSPIDPRGFLTFGISGLGVLILSVAAMSSGRLPRKLAWLGAAFGVLLVLVYLGRLIVLDATSPLILVPAAIAGLVASPVFYVWLGRELLQSNES